MTPCYYPVIIKGIRLDIPGIVSRFRSLVDRTPTSQQGVLRIYFSKRKYNFINLSETVDYLLPIFKHAHFKAKLVKTEFSERDRRYIVSFIIVKIN